MGSWNCIYSVLYCQTRHGQHTVKVQGLAVLQSDFEKFVNGFLVWPGYAQLLEGPVCF